MVIKSVSRVFALACLLTTLGWPAPGPATSPPFFWAPFVLVGDGGTP
jgi:CHAT domain-containing protein